VNERPNYITPAGYRRLREEYEALFAGERPKLLETIAWAAANGDRSENADYQYGKRRLREVDRRINFLSRRLKDASVIDPAGQPDRERVWFGAEVVIEDEAGGRRRLTLIGEDEAEAGAGRISWNSPMARALKGARIGDLRRVALPSGEMEYEVIEIAYPEAPHLAGRS
jgi:transcription elongation factor GreB